MTIRLNHPIKLTFDQLVTLDAILENYRDHFGEVDTELKAYRYQLCRQLIKRLDTKGIRMTEALQRRCRMTFTLAEVVFCRQVLLDLEFSHRWQDLLALFDQAKVNLLPLHPT